MISISQQFLANKFISVKVILPKMYTSTVGGRQNTEQTTKGSKQNSRGEEASERGGEIEDEEIF